MEQLRVEDSQWWKNMECLSGEALDYLETAARKQSSSLHEPKVVSEAIEVFCHMRASRLSVSCCQTTYATRIYRTYKTSILL